MNENPVSDKRYFLIGISIGAVLIILLYLSYLIILRPDQRNQIDNASNYKVNQLPYPTTTSIQTSKLPITSAALADICTNTNDLPMGYLIQSNTTNINDSDNSDVVKSGITNFYDVMWIAPDKPTIFCDIKVYQSPEQAKVAYRYLDYSVRNANRFGLRDYGEERYGHLFVYSSVILYGYTVRTGRVITDITVISDYELEYEFIDNIVSRVIYKLNNYEIN